MMKTKSILKRSSSVLLSSLLVLGMLAAIPAKAENGGANLVGHYKGFLDLSVIGNPRLEEFQVLLNKGGTAVVVVDEDGMEMESSALGIWKGVGPKMVQVGVIQFRAGERICALISPPDGRDDNVCTMRIALQAMVDAEDNMTGNVVIKVMEFDDTSLIPTPIPLVDVRRTRLDDFVFPQ